MIFKEIGLAKDFAHGWVFGREEMFVASRSTVPLDSDVRRVECRDKGSTFRDSQSRPRRRLRANQMEEETTASN